MQALRAQADKKDYENEMKQVLEEEANLSLRQGRGFESPSGGQQRAWSGKRQPGSSTPAPDGRDHQRHVFAGPSGVGLNVFSRRSHGRVSRNWTRPLLWRDAGLELDRFQSATPPRVDARTVDFDSLSPQPGDDEPRRFPSARNQRRGNRSCAI